MQADIDKKIKWAIDATEAQHKAQTDLDSSVAKLQQELKSQVGQSRCTNAHFQHALKLSCHSKVVVDTVNMRYPVDSYNRLWFAERHRQQHDDRWW